MHHSRRLTRRLVPLTAVSALGLAAVLVPPAAAAEVTAIADVQGTGDATPLAGTTVTVEGVVTADHTTGGYRGIYVQTAGSGGDTDATPGASDGIFVFLGSRTTTAVVGDSVRLTQVIGNLLNNAVKYTERGGRIVLRARLVGQAIEVSVRDTGIGIDPEMLPRVFELFAQVERNSARAKGGLGIGLSLARRIVELHEQGHDTREAVTLGLQRSGRIITSAALLMVIVSAGFAAGDLLVMKQMGTALVLAIIIDATLVRMLLVPATMSVLGSANWWAPAPLRRLHERWGITE